MCGQLTIIGYSFTLADHRHLLIMLPKAAQCGEGVGIELSPDTLLGVLCHLELLLLG